jgi:hypothetical protein
MTDEPIVLCKTPTPGKKGTRIHQWKYDLIRRAILEVIPQDEVGIHFKDLPRLVRGLHTQEDLQRLGSLGWYTTTLKLDLEVHSELERIPGKKPQCLR